MTRGDWCRAGVSTADVKPSNILISKDGVIKLCDFGIAGVLQGSFCSTNIGCARFMAVSGGATVGQCGAGWASVGRGGVVGCARALFGMNLSAPLHKQLASAQLGSWLRCYVAFHLQPERIDSSPGVIIKYDSRSDVWSFGLTMVWHC